MQRSIRLAPAAIVLLALCLSGCAGTALAPAHPNQINAFDGAAYDSLIMVQASLGRVTQEMAAHPEFAQYKQQVNLAINAYNATQAAYKLYHTAAGGTPTQAQTDALNLQIVDVVGQVSKLLTALGVKL